MSEQESAQAIGKTNVRTNSAVTRFAKMTPAEIATAMADAKGWQPEDGAEINGVVLGVKQAISEVNDTPYPLVFILSDTGETVAVHCFHTVLRSEMLSQRPLPGESIYIKRIGEADTAKKGQSPTVRYAVYVTREGTANNPWDHMAN